MDYLKGWRTVIGNGAVLAVAWLNDAYDFVQLDGNEEAAVVVTVLAIANMGARYLTTTPIGKKPE